MAGGQVGQAKYLSSAIRNTVALDAAMCIHGVEAFAAEATGDQHARVLVDSSAGGGWKVAYNDG